MPFVYENEFHVFICFERMTKKNANNNNNNIGDGSRKNASRKGLKKTVLLTPIPENL